MKVRGPRCKYSMRPTGIENSWLRRTVSSSEPAAMTGISGRCSYERGVTSRSQLVGRVPWPGWTALREDLGVLMTTGSVRPLKVFISYTVISYTAEDLEGHARALEKAVLMEEWVPVGFRNWPASGRLSVDACREKVRGCDLLVVLVAHRYGWVPASEEGGEEARKNNPEIWSRNRVRMVSLVSDGCASRPMGRSGPSAGNPPPVVIS